VIAGRDAQGEVVWDGCAVDGTVIKAHPDAAGTRHAPKKKDAVGDTKVSIAKKGGFSRPAN